MTAILLGVIAASPLIALLIGAIVEAIEGDLLPLGVSAALIALALIALN
jgi:uncharacterized membrane protein